MAKEKKEYEVKYNLVTINIFGTLYFLALIGILVYLYLKGILWSDKDISKYAFDVLPWVITILWFVLHEIIHGIFYVLGGAKKENISYGVALEKGIFFCKCNNYITKKNAILSLMAPFTIIGVITFIISLCIGDIVLLALSLFNIYGACGDLTIFMFFLKMPNDIEFREFGDTTSFIIRTSEKLKTKYFGIKSITEVEKDSIPIDVPDKKVQVSKGSKPILIFFAIVIIIDIISMFLSK